MEENKETFLIIDSNSIIHRAFHALPPLTNQKGEVVNAVYGFLLMLFRVIKDFDPKYIAACFDLPEPTLRKKSYPEYKATRKKAPDELYAQIPMVKEILKSFDIPVFEKSGYEGDDLIGTLSEFAGKNHSKKIKNVIISGDLDNLQLVDKNTNVYFLNRGIKEGILYNCEAIKKRYEGLSPEQIVTLKSLKGDASDNIPGVKGIGEKTAIQLIKDYESLEAIYKEAEKSEPRIKGAVLQKLLDYKKEAFLSYDLAKIEKNVPIKVSIEDCAWKGFDKEKAREHLEEFGFKSLSKKLPGAEPEEKIKKEPKKEKAKKQIGENLKLW
ncbi:MAG: 5'-3' exonuclease H3TH domain-containing protein [Candidatus Paceibacterota bacterium]